jgi:steroid 5-alpha reductase family enzyme
MHILISTLLADIAATIVVWLCGIFLNNSSSVYDPYWSAAPIFILISWIFVLDVQVTAAEILFIIAILVWGFRLTLNWAVRWKGMDIRTGVIPCLRDNRRGCGSSPI